MIYVTHTSTMHEWDKMTAGLQRSDPLNHSLAEAILTSESIACDTEVPEGCNQEASWLLLATFGLVTFLAEFEIDFECA